MKYNISGEVGRNFYEKCDYLHEVLVSRLSDCDPKFTSRFQIAYQQAMETDIWVSTAFHPQTNGQLEHTI